MLLYEHPLSSYAQKVKIALREKGVAFTAELPESFGTGRQDGPFAAANPRTEVPVLIDGDVTVFDSTVILEYIEERCPEPPLLPRDPAARAFARITEDVCDTHYEAVNWGFGEILWFRRATGTLADHLRAEAAAQTRVLQDWLTGRLGRREWFGGEGFGWADAAVAPMVNRSVHYGMGPEPGSPSPSGMPGSVRAPPSRRPSLSSTRRPQRWPPPRRCTRPAAAAGNTGTIASNGWSSPAGSRWCWRVSGMGTSASPGRAGCDGLVRVPPPLRGREERCALTANPPP
ncbi:glutathione S-transferase family protein [Methylobacterium persicinum]